LGLAVYPVGLILGAMAEHDTFTIRESGGRWILRLNARGVASFASREEAERAALEGIEVCRRSGRAAEVFIQFDGEPVNLIAKSASGLTGPIQLGPEPDPELGTS
jgi:hypothetical protein